MVYIIKVVQYTRQQKRVGCELIFDYQYIKPEEY